MRSYNSSGSKVVAGLVVATSVDIDDGSDSSSVSTSVHNSSALFFIVGDCGGGVGLFIDSGNNGGSVGLSTNIDDDIGGGVGSSTDAVRNILSQVIILLN